MGNIVWRLRYCFFSGYFIFTLFLARMLKRGRSRKILEKKLGRKLRSNERCHHRDHNPENDDPKNLEALTKHEHNILHFKGKNALYKYRKKQRG